MQHICEIWVRDRNGRIVTYRKIKKALLTRNFGSLFAAILKLAAKQQADATTYPIKDRTSDTQYYIGGAGGSASIAVYYNQGNSGAFTCVASGLTQLRVCCGIAPSPTTATILDRELTQPYTSANAGVPTLATDEATGKIRVSVQGSIGFAESKTVTEVGLYFGFQDTSANARDCLLARDVPSTPISVGAGQTLTIKYTWVFN